MYVTHCTIQTYVKKYFGYAALRVKRHLVAGTVLFLLRSDKLNFLAIRKFQFKILGMQNLNFVGSLPLGGAYLIVGRFHFFGKYGQSFVLFGGRKVQTVISILKKIDPLKLYIH